MSIVRRSTVALLLLALFAGSSFVLFPSRIDAAALEFTAPVKAALDKLTAKTDAKTASGLYALYNQLYALQAQDRNIEEKIKALHYRNQENASLLRKQIRGIDAARLDKLKQEVERAKKRHQPLFDLYASIGRQIAAAKPLKSKTFNAALKAQQDGLKPAVQLAKDEIKAKEAALKTAKAEVARTIKAARDAVDAVGPLNVQIRAHRSAASFPRKSLSPVWTNFKYAAKQFDARAAADALETSIMLSKQILEKQQQIWTLENRIAVILDKTRAQYIR